MAWCFGLAAECGVSRREAQALAGHFQGLSLRLSDGLEVDCEADLWSDETGNWWALVGPVGMSVGREIGEATINDSVHTTEAGFLLYDRLRTAPFYRYALVGWEVDGFRMFRELGANELRDSGFAGIVLSKSVWEDIGRPTGFEIFAAGYVWKPYKGEIFNKLPEPAES